MNPTDQQPNDGGPAFPVPPERINDNNGDKHWCYAHPGMTLRDYFAARVAPTYAQMSDGTTGPCYAAKIKLWSPSAVARQAYLVADAMIAERSRKQ